MEKIKRRDFLKKASAATVAGGALVAGCGQQQGSAPLVKSSQTYEWKMVTTWPPTLPILQDSAKLVAKWVEEMSVRVGDDDLLPRQHTAA